MWARHREEQQRQVGEESRSVKSNPGWFMSRSARKKKYKRYECLALCKSFLAVEILPKLSADKTVCTSRTEFLLNKWFRIWVDFYHWASCLKKTFSINSWKMATEVIKFSNTAVIFSIFRPVCLTCVVCLTWLTLALVSVLLSHTFCVDVVHVSLLQQLKGWKFGAFC